MLLTLSVLSATSKQCFEQPAASFLVCSLLFIEYQNIKTSYRDIITPTVKYVKRISEEAQKKNYTVTVLVPQFIPNKPWQNILHNQMSLKLKYALRWHQDVVVASYSYHLKE